MLQYGSPMSCRAPEIRLRISLLLVFLLLLLCHGYGQDCTLSAYLEKGIACSPELKDLANQVRSNRYDSLIARATYLPQVNFNSALAYAPVVNGWGYSEVITNGQVLTGTLVVNQQIFKERTREASYEKYRLETKSIANSREISLGELRMAITAQYLAACAALEERKYQQEIHQALEQESRILKTWTDQGIYHQSDYLSLQLEILSLEQNISDLDLQYRKEFWNLYMICGIADTLSCDLVLPSIGETPALDEGRSPFFRKFLIDSLMLRNEQTLIDRPYKPALGWFANGGLVNNEPRYIYRNFGASFGLTMTLPVFDGNQRKISCDKIRVREETRRVYQENFRFRHQAMLQQPEAELDQTRKMLDQNEKQVALSMELISVDRFLLGTGFLPVTGYILAVKGQVFPVLLFLFRDFPTSLLVIFISVLGTAGSLLALFITGIRLNVGSYTGIIMIVGIIAENAIFTVNQFRANMRTSSGDLDGSIHYAISLRIRPKLMTAIGATLALAPLALGIGVGAQMQQPHAIAVIGGYIMAIPLLLFVFPSLLRLIFTWKAKINTINSSSDVKS